MRWRVRGGRGRYARLAANPAEVEEDATALADRHEQVGIGITRAHSLCERLVVGKPGIAGAE
jgi:hypothetical protein